MKNSKTILKQELFSLGMQEDENSGVLLNSMQSLLWQLAASGSRVEDDDCKAILLKSLPPWYSELATIIWTNDSLDIIDSIGMLLSEEK